MRTHQLLEAIPRVSIAQLETSPRIEKRAMIGSFAVVHGSRIWASNLLTVDDARASINTYHAVLGPVDLKIVFIER